MESALQQAIEKAGGCSALAKRLGVSRQAVSGWKICPPHRVIAVEEISGVRRERLRPNMYPEEWTVKP